MPFTLPPLSRRRFLAGSLAAGAAAMLAPQRLLAREADLNRFALLADTHIAQDIAKVNNKINMYENFQHVSKELLALETPPAAVLVDGDLAFGTGQAGDYTVLVELLKPLREAGLPIHLALGNHDNRERFWAAIPQETKEPKPVVDKHVTVIQAPRANLFLLDSLDVTNKTPGILGEKQIAWLGQDLDSRADKPAVVMVHHNPDDKEVPSGLVETKAVMESLLPRKHVKALVFGHTHDWKLTEREGMHLVNLPPVAYPFNDQQPTGWVDMHLELGGAKLQLFCHKTDHPQHKRIVELAWR